MKIAPPNRASHSYVQKLVAPPAEVDRPSVPASAHRCRAVATRNAPAPHAGSSTTSPVRKRSPTRIDAAKFTRPDASAGLVKCTPAERRTASASINSYRGPSRSQIAAPGGGTSAAAAPPARWSVTSHHDGNSLGARPCTPKAATADNGDTPSARKSGAVRVSQRAVGSARTFR